jgi:hypothetical protein
MQFMILFTAHPEKAKTPAPADLREAEFEKIRGLYTDGLVRQIWVRGDAGGGARIGTRMQGSSAAPPRLRCGSNGLIDDF